MRNSPRAVKIVIGAVVALVFAGSYFARLGIERAEAVATQKLGHARRIVSMAPSTTETLFALGLGDRVVGVSRFCNYPPAARDKPRVGGYYDPNFEAIVALGPDLIVMLEGHREHAPAFARLGLPTLTVEHRGIDGILESIDSIGRACDAEQSARRILDDIDARLAQVARLTAGHPRPRVMFAIDRTLDTHRIEDVYIAGSDGHIDRIIELAGGRNVYDQGGAHFPLVSSEGILQMNPEVIIDLVPGLSVRATDAATLLADWNQLAEVGAVRSHRVYVIDDDYAYVPGPRFILLVEKLARLIHPEVSWPEEPSQP